MVRVKSGEDNKMLQRAWKGKGEKEMKIEKEKKYNQKENHIFLVSIEKSVGVREKVDLATIVNFRKE